MSTINRPLQLYGEGYDSLASGHFLPFLVLCPALKDDHFAPIVTRAFLDDTMTGEGIAQAYHAHEAYLEPGKMCLREVRNVLGGKLPKKGHAEHPVGDDAIQPHTACSLLIKMNRIGVARCFGVVLQLLLRDRWLHQWR